MLLSSFNCVYHLIVTSFEWFLEGYYDTLFCITLNKPTLFQKTNSLEQHYSVYLFKVQEPASYNLKCFFEFRVLIYHIIQIAGSKAKLGSWKNKFISNIISECMLSYGENCQYPCSFNCINQTCDKFNGSCLHSCKHGWQCNTGILFCILRMYDCFV